MVDFEYDEIEIPMFETRAVIVNITTSPTTSKGRYDIRFIATSEGGPQGSVWLNTSLVKDFDNRTIDYDDKVKMNYIGYFPEGVIFDTSIREVAQNANFSRSPATENRTQFEPFAVFVNATDPDQSDAYGSSILGFWQSVLGMKVNETKVVRLTPAEGYDDGLWRLFEITIVSIDT